MKKRILNILGLAQKAGRLAAGERAVEDAIRSGKARLLLIAKDASANSRKHPSDMAVYRSLPYVFWGNKEELGRTIGKEERSGIVINDPGLADRIQVLLKEESEEKEGE